MKDLLTQPYKANKGQQGQSDHCDTLKNICTNIFSAKKIIKIMSKKSFFYILTFEDKSSERTKYEIFA